MNGVTPVNFIWGGNKTWALNNQAKGRNALVCGLINTAFGFAKTFTTTEESFLNKAFEFIQAVLFGARNHEQYSIYSQSNDDLEEDKIVKPYAANIGLVACFIEKYINPILLPASKLFGEQVSKAYEAIAHLGNGLWWRSRLLSEKIEWKGIKRVFKYDIKNLFNTEKRKPALDNVVKKLRPLFGLIGVGSVSLFTPIKSFCKFSGMDNKLINAATAIGSCSQNAYYFFKFTLDYLFRYKEKRSNLLLGSLGLGANITNCSLPIIELLPEGKLKTIWREVACGLLSGFFSFRRHSLGKEWLVENLQKIDL